ncbi:acyl-CoA dehydrogenase family protein [Niabella terrae]
MNTAATSEPIKGAQWLVTAAGYADTFISEEFGEEEQMIRDMCTQFLETEVLPILDQIDDMEEGLMRSLVEKAGAQGLLSAALPEKYGGLGKDFITSTIINEYLGAGHSFSVAIAAHTGIGTLPILYFGTEAQKEKYIPQLATGEWAGAYGLTEPNSGSDALSAKTTARLSEDGKHYLLNGQKCWITNGGFAQVYTVFAKVNGEQFTGFIVERGMEGFTNGPEEKKMGIKGSSTVQLYFQDAKIPVENLLGEIGKGHRIAFNILNIGRLKLCAAALGGAKMALNLSITYARTREQFGKPIAEFGAIQHKLAEMAIRVYAAESALYRTAKWINDLEERHIAAGKPFNEAVLAAAEEYAIECAILKVYGSELLDFVADEGVQIHGGNGYSAEYDISRAYRDSRINRIYEGTNEINRLLILDMTLKRAMQGRLDLMGPAMAVQQELMSIPDFGSGPEVAFEAEKKLVAGFKKAILMVAGAAVQKLMTKIESEQEVLMALADMAINCFHAESILLRTEKLNATVGAEKTQVQLAMTRTFLYDAADAIHKSGKDAINAFAEGDEQRMLLMGLKRFTKAAPFNTKEARREIAAALLDAGKFRF